MKPLDTFQRDFRGKHILIFGLGLLGCGVGDAKFFSDLGNKVTVTDLKPAAALQPSLNKLKTNHLTLHLGGHREEDIDASEVIIRNASVPWNHPLLDRARHQGKPVYMDTQLFLKYAAIDSVGITGTRGKTTTTMLIYHILSQGLTGRQILLGGNIKDTATLPLLASLETHRHPLIVLELSSWQLEAFNEHALAPNIALVTNLYPDHLNRYPSYQAYCDSKKAIFSHQQPTDHVILNQHQPEFAHWAKQARSQVHWFSHRTIPQSLKLKLAGKHNRLNAAAAFEVSSLLGVDSAVALSVIKAFKPLEYRLQPLSNKLQRRIYNDSTSTTPIATIKALNSVPGKIHLIFGGEDKELPVEAVATTINQLAFKVYLLNGSGTAKIQSLINSELIVGNYDSLKPAVTTALSQSSVGDTILFSPGFTSFGMWDNEYHRGISFNQLITKLEHET